VQATEVARRGSRGLAAAAALLLAFGLVGGAFALIARTPSGREIGIPLDDIDDGVSLQHVEDDAVIFVRHGGAVSAFSQVDARNDRVIWCQDADRFVTLRDGSHFAPDGHKLGGPSPAGLLPIGLRIDGDRVVLSTSHRFDLPRATWTDAVAGQWTNAGDAACPPY
jgi:hypothetical protein